MGKLLGKYKDSGIDIESNQLKVKYLASASLSEGGESVAPDITSESSSDIAGWPLISSAMTSGQEEMHKIWQEMYGNTKLGGRLNEEKIPPGVEDYDARRSKSGKIRSSSYVDMNHSDKLNEIFRLMAASQKILDANRVSSRTESYLAGIMLNEGSRNQQRRALGNYFNSVAKNLKNVNLEELRENPIRLSEYNMDEQCILNRALTGKLKFNDKTSVLQAGIDCRVEQYDRMSSLAAQPARTAEEDQELAQLRDVAKDTTGYGGSLGDAEGMSTDRFRGIYDEGQRRFEIGHYKNYKNILQGQLLGDNAFTLSHSAGRVTFTSTMQEQLRSNNDLLADMSTSYGIDQILGVHGTQGKLKANGSDGNEHVVGLEELKASAERLSPSSKDVLAMIAYLRMNNVNMQNPPDVKQIASVYNGKNWEETNPQYANRLDSNSFEYGGYQKHPKEKY